MFNNSIGELDY